MGTLVSPNGTRVGGIRSQYKDGFVTWEEDWHYLVKADGLHEDRQSIIFNTNGLALPGDVVSGSIGSCVVRGSDAQRMEENSLYWDVTQTQSNDPQSSSQNQSGDPIAFTPLYRTQFDQLEEVVQRDYEGKPALNSAGKPFDTGFTIRRFVPVWEFSQFELPTITDEQIIDRNETVNSHPFRGRQPWTLLLTIVNSEVLFFNGYRVRLTTYRLAYNFRTWRHKRLDVGWVYRTGNAPNYTFVPFLEKGQPVLGNLASNGNKLTPADAEPRELEFELNKEIDFNNFLRF